MAQVPAWHLVVSTESAADLQELFTDVMQELPVSKAQFAEDAGVSTITLWRWAEGKTTPDLDRMLVAAETAEAHLERLHERASLLRQALHHVAQAQKWREAEGLGAGQEEVEALKELLSKLDKGEGAKE